MTPQERLARTPTRGRPALPPEHKLRQYTLRLTPAEMDKLQRLGGRHWVSKKLAQVREASA